MKRNECPEYRCAGGISATGQKKSESNGESLPEAL